MADFCRCSSCEADLRAGEIPDKYLYMYGAEQESECRYGCGGKSHYSRLIGIYSRESDRTISWMCPDCGHTEERR